MTYTKVLTRHPSVCLLSGITVMFLLPELLSSVRQYNQGIWDLSKVYLTVLLDRVSAGEVLEADSNLSIGINFTVFSFVMAYK